MIARLDRHAIAAALREAAQILELRGENRFRAKAFARAARVVERLSEDLSELVRERRLTGLEGIGPALATVITELHETGRSGLIERLRAEMPAGAIELAGIPGLTARRQSALRSALGIENLDQLEAAAREGKIAGVKGFGPKTERQLLAAIERHKTGGESVLLVQALEAAELFRDYLRRLPDCVDAEITGAVRRFEETVSLIELVAAFPEPEGKCEFVARFPAVVRVEAQTADSCTVRLGDGLRVRVTITTPGAFAGTCLETTGSGAHVARLHAMGLDLNARGGEAGIYRRIGLPFVPPELREDAGEIEAALAGDAFEDLVAERDIQGMVHCHTTYSDGKNSVEEMARAAEAMGMTFITITDHSPTASYAGGLDPDRLRRQWDEIDRVQERVAIRLLKGTESDILEDGSLDYPGAILERLEVVIASVHTRHKLDAEQMTRRVIRAMEQPMFKIWGHALGRLLKRREPFQCDVEAILDAISGSRAAIEINGDPHRLDLPPRWAREARKRRIPFVISTDAHSTGQLRNLRFGVGIARRAGIRRGQVLNALDADAFADAVRPGSP